MSYGRKQHRKIQFYLPLKSRTPGKWERSVLISLSLSKPEWDWGFSRRGLRYGLMYANLGFLYLGVSGWEPKTRIPGEYATPEEVEVGLAMSEREADRVLRGRLMH